jgi:hypothetical protein
MRSLSWIVVLAACGTPQSPPAKPDAAFVTHSNASKPLPKTTRVRPPNRCVPDGIAAMPPHAASAKSASVTCVDHIKAEANIAKTLRARYRPTRPGSVIDVSFGCDPLTGPVREVVLETGYGHGGSFTLWHLLRTMDNLEFRVTGVAHHYPHASYERFTYGYADGFKVRIARATLPAATVDQALDLARPALTARIREIMPSPEPNAGMGMSGFSSSANFHHSMRIRDDSRFELTAHFTGYPNSEDQQRYLGLQLAMRALEPMLRELPFKKLAATGSDRALVVSQFLRKSAQPRRWWVRNRYQRLVSRIGTTAALPRLLETLRVLSAKPKPSDPNGDSAMTDLVSVIAALTGSDLRFDDQGNPREVREVAKQILDECGEALKRSSGG